MRSYLAQQRRQARRLAATGLAVAVSVLFVVTTLLATSSFTAYAGAGAGHRERAADVVVRPGESGQDIAYLDRARIRRLSALPQVASSAVDRVATLNITWPDGPRVARVESADSNRDRPWFALRSGRAPRGVGEVLLDAASADRLGVAPGSRLPVVRDGRAGLPGELVVTGLYSVDGPQPDRPELLADGAEMARWSTITGPDPTLRQLLLVARPGTTPQALAAAVGAADPAVSVESGAAAAKAAQAQAAGQVQTVGRVGLIFTAIAGLVAIIVIGNTFTVLMAQRARDLALLRCLGATRRQVRRAVLVEAAALGLVASLTGAVAAIVLVAVVAAVARLVWPAAAGLHTVVTLPAVALPVVLGTLLTIVAGLAPARRAGRVAPLAALRPDAADVLRRRARVRIGLAVLFACAAGPLLALAVANRSAPLTGIGAVALVASALLATPVLVPWASRLAGRLLHRAGPVARVGAANAARDAERSAATCTALLVGVLAVCSLLVAGATVQSSVTDAVRRNQPVDLVLDTLSAAAGPGGGLRPGVREGVAGTPGIVAVAALRAVEVRVEATSAGAAALGSTGPARVLAGDPAQVQGVVRGGAALDDASLLVGPEQVGPDGVPGLPAGLRDGSKVVLVAGPKARVPLTVRIVPGLPAPLVTRVVADRLSGRPDAAALWARAVDGADPQATTAAVRSVMAATGSGLTFDDVSAADGPAGAVTKVDYLMAGAIVTRSEIESALGIAVTAAAGMLAMAVLVALIGIANTLALSVHERTREFGLVRALGATRRQVRGSLVVEALVVSGVGAALGLVLGIVLGWALAYSAGSEGWRVTVPVVPVPRIGAVLVAALGAACLASILPGRRAAQVPPVEALRQA